MFTLSLYVQEARTKSRVLQISENKIGNPCPNAGFLNKAVNANPKLVFQRDADILIESLTSLPNA